MYRDRWSQTAAEFYEGLQKNLRSRVDEAVRTLLEDPAAPPSKMLKGPLRGKRSRRVGNLRLIYTIDREAELVDILVLAWRRDAYGRW